MDDFEQQLLKCSTLKKLELLHERVVKTIPAAQRRYYIELLNRREDLITRELFQKGDYD